jgi:hypothetical protein
VQLNQKWPARIAELDEELEIEREHARELEEELKLANLKNSPVISSLDDLHTLLKQALAIAIEGT